MKKKQKNDLANIFIVIPCGAILIGFIYFFAQPTCQRSQYKIKPHKEYILKIQTMHAPKVDEEIHAIWNGHRFISIED